ncbi:hypothetical protein OsI_07225 [Oryza sativa Indica Group]|uniref:Uncharacterized protein n=1 Tax=Oryza sativa subsp. indica TaxID=39946 RepID=B8AHX4_ORYSI|nr:hypothetical protein OsI_07225 [Oryza sativa Indica Group]
MAILCHGSHTGVTPYTTQLRLGSVTRELRRGEPGPGEFHGWCKLVNAQTKDLDIDG